MIIFDPFLDFDKFRDLLATLDDIHRDNFALIVDGPKLIGIVTTADVWAMCR